MQENTSHCEYCSKPFVSKQKHQYYLYLSSHTLKTFEANLYFHLSSFLFDDCIFFCARLSGHRRIWLLFPIAIKEKLLQMTPATKSDRFKFELNVPDCADFGS